MQSFTEKKTCMYKYIHLYKCFFFIINEKKCAWGQWEMERQCVTFHSKAVPPPLNDDELVTVKQRKIVLIKKLYS